LYPLNVEKQELVTKGQLLSPRMACKLFHDGLYIIKKAEESPKFIQDRIPEVAHKCFKKKQWYKYSLTYLPLLTYSLITFSLTY